MEDFYEKIVKKEKNIKDLIISVLMVIGALVLVFYILPILISFASFLSALWPIAFVATVYLLYKLITARNIEYEYILTSGDLDIDSVIARRKRKRLLNIHSRKFEILAPYNDRYKNEYKTESLKKLDFSANINNPANYFAIFMKDGERVCLVFEPSESIVQKIKTIIPRNVIVD